LTRRAATDLTRRVAAADLTGRRRLALASTLRDRASALLAWVMAFRIRRALPPSTRVSPPRCRRVTRCFPPSTFRATRRRRFFPPANSSGIFSVGATYFL